MLENNYVYIDIISEFFFYKKWGMGFEPSNFRMPAERTTNSATDPHVRPQQK